MSSIPTCSNCRVPLKRRLEIEESRCRRCWRHWLNFGKERPLTRQCRVCHRDRPLVWFPNQSKTCAQCKPPPEYEAALAEQGMVRTAGRARFYGLTLSDIKQLYEQQEHRCAICRRAYVADSLVIDHDHETGAVRGLLCMNCNSGLGKLGDTTESLRRAIAYLERPVPFPDHKPNKQTRRKPSFPRRSQPRTNVGERDCAPTPHPEPANGVGDVE